MQQISVAPLYPRSTRRWPRYQIDLPVRVIAVNGILTTPVMGRGRDISRAGMALHATIALNPGDLMQLQFPTAEPSRVNAVVRHRSGSLLGLEFLSQLPPDDETKIQLNSGRTQSPAVSTAPLVSCTPVSVQAALRRKQEELHQLKQEIDVLRIAILLLEEDEREICPPPIRPRLQSENRPWPLPS